MLANFRSSTEIGYWKYFLKFMYRNLLRTETQDLISCVLCIRHQRQKYTLIPQHWTLRNRLDALIDRSTLHSFRPIIFNVKALLCSFTVGKYCVISLQCKFWSVWMRKNKYWTLKDMPLAYAAVPVYKCQRQY